VIDPVKDLGKMEKI